MVAIIMATSAAASAQADQGPADDADAIIVIGSRSQFRINDSNSATRIPLPVIETPQSISIISDELIRTAYIRSSLDLTDYVVGVEKAGQGDGTLPILTARGFDVDRERAYKINGLAVDAEVDIDYGLVDRVEVVRGSSSMLYGDSDFGATLNRQLKMPTRSRQFFLAAEADAFGSYRAEADAGGPLTSDGRLRGRIAVAGGNTKSATDFVYSKQFAISGALAYDIAPGTLLSFSGFHQRRNGRYTDGLAALPDGTIDGLPFRSFAGMDFNASNTRISFISGELKSDLTEALGLLVRVGYSDVKFVSRASFILDASPFEDIFPGGTAPLDPNGNPVSTIQPSGYAPLFAFGADRYKKNFSADATLSWKFGLFGQENILAISGDYKRQTITEYNSDFFFSGLINLFDDAPLASTPEQRAIVNDTSFFTDRETFTISGVTPQLVLRPTEKLTALLGFRWTRGELRNVNALPPRGRTDATVPRVGLVYKASPLFNPYASYSEGIIFNVGLLNADRENISPERGKQIELGVKGEFAAGRAGYSLALFRIKRTGGAVLVDFDLGGGNDIYANIAEQVHKGVELELNGRVLPGFNVNASYAYVDVNISQSEDPAQVGQRPANVPKHSIKMFGTYAFPQESALGGLSIGGGATYRSSVEANNVGTLTLPSFVRFDLRASYDVSDNFVVEAAVDNITDELSLNSSYGGSDAGLKYFDPRTVRIRASYRF